MYRLEYKGKHGTYSTTTPLSFEDACASKERASNKIAFSGFKINIIDY